MLSFVCLSSFVLKSCNSAELLFVPCSAFLARFSWLMTEESLKGDVGGDPSENPLDPPLFIIVLYLLVYHHHHHHHHQHHHHHPSQMLQIPLSDKHCNNHIVALGILGLFLTDGLWVKAINWECTLVYINPECFRYRSVPIISHKPFCTKTQQNWIDKWPPSPTSPPALSEHMYGG